MPLPVNLAYELLNEAGFAEIDEVYTTNLPPEVVDSTDKTIVLITEVFSSPTDYGNDQFHSLENSVEVQLFYKLNIDFDIAMFEIKLMRWFEQHHWQIEQSKPHTLDPDTNQVTKVFYFAQIQIL